MGCNVTLRKLEKTLPDGKKVRTHDRYLWRATFMEGGVRKQKYFKTKAEATEWKSEREQEAVKHGTAISLTSDERVTVCETREKLSEAGLTLREAVAIALKVRENETRSCSFSELAGIVVESRRKAGRSDCYVLELKSKLGKFEDKFGDRKVATIETREVEEWLFGLGLSPGSVNSYRRILVIAFNEAIRHGFADRNPAEASIRAKEIESEVEILEPNEAELLLRGADSEIVPAIAIGLFAGLRSAELKRLDWKDVRLDHAHITVRAENAKSAKNRIVPIGDNLRKWLAAHQREEGSVWPTDGRRLMGKARNNAGFGTPTEQYAAKAKGEHLRPWPKNALRHSYATYHLAGNQNAAELALNMGHEGTSLIFAHYRKPVTRDMASAFWNIKPEGEQVLEFGASMAAA